VRFQLLCLSMRRVESMRCCWWFAPAPCSRRRAAPGSRIGVQIGPKTFVKNSPKSSSSCSVNFCIKNRETGCFKQILAMFSTLGVKRAGLGLTISRSSIGKHRSIDDFPQKNRRKIFKISPGIAQSNLSARPKQDRVQGVWLDADRDLRQCLIRNMTVVSAHLSTFR